MERRAMIRCAVLLVVWLSAGTVCPEAAAVPPLQNASPLKAGGERGYAPLKPGYAISFTPIGWRFSSAEAQLPDVFLRAPNGLAATQGMYVARFRYMSPEGRPVYAQPEKIDLSVSGISRLPVGAAVPSTRRSRTTASAVRYRNRPTWDPAWVRDKPVIRKPWPSKVPLKVGIPSKGRPVRSRSRRSFTVRPWL